MNDPGICFDKIYKSYLNTPVFSGLSVRFPSGRLIGLLGENGVGKTTLLKMAAGILKPDKGEIQIHGQSQKPSFTAKVSWLLSPKDFYPFFRVKDAYQYYQDFYPDFDSKKALKLIEQWNLPMEQRIGRLSRGEAERLCLFLALCRKVPIYLMDEPAAGFDIKLKRDLIRILLSELDEDATVILATHLLRDFEDIFDTLVILTKNGVCMADTDAVREKGMSVEEYYLEVIA
ncbi:MAG: ATP-binding cassette domain-containing protein [Lachnospiraceae bacterium]